MKRPAAAIPVIVAQHLEDAAVLHTTRTALTRAPHVKLNHLLRFDNRLEAHLDGLAVAGQDAWPAIEAMFEQPSCGAVFTATVRAVEDLQTGQLERLLALSEAIPEVRPGLAAAFGWLEAARLRGIVVDMLRSRNAFARWVGIAASAAHRVDPGLIAARYLEDADPLVRARAWRAAGELGKHELVSTAGAALADEDPLCQFWVAWAAVLLGDRQRALEVIAAAAKAPGPLQRRAFQLAMQAMSAPAAHAWLQSLATDPANLRWVLQGAGLIGDPAYVPWLIRQMSDDRTARIAGEAFSFITGADLAWLDLERKPPAEIPAGPNDDPDDPAVEMDEDDGLPWPDAAKVQEWWDAHSPRFQLGVRYLVGGPLNRENCLRVLREGYQRQRVAASLHSALMNPGTALFEWRAPARRQQRLLAQLT